MKKLLLTFLTLIFLSQFCIAQIVNIPDDNFKAALIEVGVDLNNDGEIQVSEAEAITSVDVVNKNISSLEGINSFVNLTVIYANSNHLTEIDISELTSIEYLYLSYNQLTSIDVSNLTSLKFLGVFGNSLTSINFSGLTNLKTLNLNQNQLTNINLNGLTNLTTLNAGSNQFSNLNLSGLTSLKHIVLEHNQLTNINLSGLTNLTFLNITNNQLSSLDVSDLTNLTTLNVEYNQLTNINLNGLTSLERFSIWDNLLTNIDVSDLTNLKFFYIHNNLLTDLNVSDLTLLEYLYAYNNPLITLNIKNGSNEYLSIDYNNTLEYICVDSEEVSAILQEVENVAANTIVNSYCSFISGGEFYIIEGHNNLYLDDIDCENSDAFYPNLQFSITDGTSTGAFISNDSGDYSIYVQEGSHTITPILENPTYYSISPSSFTVNFPTDNSPFTQDFCITPLGDFSDIEVSIIPLDDARPGFDANYKIIYKNKGTTTISSTLELIFQDIYMDLVSATPSPDEQIQSVIKWDYTNLLPFESRSIFVTMNINTPTDVPPVNGDDILIFEVSNPISNDENPNDNIATLNQTVVNSYDPNDKTCIEGKQILPTYVGEFLHYVIRFENTGTASAVNVVVKDEIDTSKLDISSLIPVDASHSFVTRIKDNNKVEFIFENIQLPFDDENNDGYISFKIKTLPSLELNDVIKNNAEIYFDFNAPIITNEYKTIVKESFTFQDVDTNIISSFPNPTKNQLFVNSKTPINSISIIDINGRLLKLIIISHQLTEYELDISKLTQGIYFLEVQSKNIKKVKKFLKK